MKNIKKLQGIVNLKVDKQSKRIKIVVYLSVCFLGVDGQEVAKYFGLKYTKVRHYITVFGLKLQKDKKFMAKMHSIAKEYKSQLELNLAS